MLGVSASRGNFSGSTFSSFAHFRLRFFFEQAVKGSQQFVLDDAQHESAFELALSPDD
jgi:hypothetical protein